MFRYTIRELVLLTLIVALGVGWWLEHRVWVERYSAKVYDSQIWQARAEQLQVRADMLAEGWRFESERAPPQP